MKNKKIKYLKKMKSSVNDLYKVYLAQANQKIKANDLYHENSHDNSGGHPNYHNNSHDNSSGKIMVYTLRKNDTN